MPKNSGHNITNHTFVEADNGVVSLWCTCGAVLHEGAAIPLLTLLKATAEHNGEHLTRASF